MKQRSLVHHVCNNLHGHLLTDLLSGHLDARANIGVRDLNGLNAMCSVILALSTTEVNKHRQEILNVLLAETPQIDDESDPKASCLLWSVTKH